MERASRDRRDARDLSEGQDPGRLPRSDVVAGLLDDGLAARLEHWAAEARVDDSARRRMRERWLRHQAEEEGSLLGVVVDLGERGVATAVHTRSGRVHHGRVGAIGTGFLVVTRDTSGVVFVALSAVASVRTRAGERPTIGDRAVTTRLTLAEVLIRLAAERERALLVTYEDASAISGTVFSVGQDMVVVRLNGGDHTGTAYVPLAAISEVVLDS